MESGQQIALFPLLSKAFTILTNYVDIESNPKATQTVLVEDCKFIAVVARGDFSMLNISLKDFSQFIFGIVINVSMSQSVALKNIYLFVFTHQFIFLLFRKCYRFYSICRIFAGVTSSIRDGNNKSMNERDQTASSSRGDECQPRHIISQTIR